MTLLCTVLTESSVLVSADASSMVYDMDDFWQPFPAVMPSEKFRPTGLPCLMWSFSGDGRVVEPVRAWADVCVCTSWEQVLEDAQEKCAEAAARARRFVRARCVSADDKRLLFSVLLSGYVNGAQGTAVIDEMGFATRLDEKDIPLPWGGGLTLAIASWNVLSTFYPGTRITNADELGAFMDAVCSSAAGLVAPVNVWEITPQRWVKIDRNGDHRDRERQG